MSLRCQYGLVWSQRGIGHGHIPPCRWEKPVVILAHGGFFLAGSNDGVDVVPLCEDLARMGYVAASISYAWALTMCLTWRRRSKRLCSAACDAKAQCGFSAITFRGQSMGHRPVAHRAGRVPAGAFIALHAAYIDDLSEVPDVIDLTQQGLGGGLEGFSGNPGYSSDVLSISTFRAP